MATATAYAPRPTEAESVAPVPAVRADIIYTVTDGQRHKAFIPPQGTNAETRRTHPDRPVTVSIRDGRPEAADFHLDRSGFAFRAVPATDIDFHDPAQVERDYYPQLEALLKAETGASRVRIFDHTVRVTGGGADQTNPTRLPVHRAHVDYTEKSGPARVRDLMGEEAENLLSRRVAEINVWRPITGPVLASPLAVAEADSLRPEHLIPTDLVFEDRVGEIYEFAHDPAHRWVYFPEMTPEEVLLLKSYDSATDGRARFTPHTAFAHPDTPADAPARQSIEVRAFLFFD